MYILLSVMLSYFNLFYIRYKHKYDPLYLLYTFWKVIEKSGEKKPTNHPSFVFCFQNRFMPVLA